MILYPIACGENGAAIHIDGWERGHAVTCFGCGEALVGRLPHDGIKPTAHFAHRAEAICCGKTALHKAAKEAIVRSHAIGVLRALSWDCPHCKRCRHLTDLCTLTLHKETSPCTGVVSDVLGLHDSGAPCLAIEVVVTHDLEAATLEHYRTQGIYVFALRPSWGIVGDILRGADPLCVDPRVGFVDTATCAGCQQVAREKAEWETRARTQRVTAWWKAWIAAWNYIGNDTPKRTEEAQRVLLALRARDAAWWSDWAGLWPRVVTQITVTWWIEWRRVWRELGACHAAPHRWQIAWCAAWTALGKQYAADEAVRAKRRHEEEERVHARTRNWWDVWLRLWPDIAQRESGVMAAWRPICQRCRQDVTRDQKHTCPRASG